MRKIWDKIVEWILNVPSDKRLHFSAGVIIAAFFAIALGMKFCVFPVIFAALFKEAFDQWTSGEWDWWDIAATVIGGLVPQVFVLLNLWWI